MGFYKTHRTISCTRQTSHLHDYEVKWQLPSCIISPQSIIRQIALTTEHEKWEANILSKLDHNLDKCGVFWYIKYERKEVKTWPSPVCPRFLISGQGLAACQPRVKTCGGHLVKLTQSKISRAQKNIQISFALISKKHRFNESQVRRRNIKVIKYGI